MMDGISGTKDIDAGLARQRGYFDTKYLNERELQELRDFSRVIPGFTFMRQLTSICELRIRLKRERKVARAYASALRSIGSMAPTRRITSAIDMALKNL